MHYFVYHGKTWFLYKWYPCYHIHSTEIKTIRLLLQLRLVHTERLQHCACACVSVCLKWSLDQFPLRWETSMGDTGCKACSHLPPVSVCLCAWELCRYEVLVSSLLWETSIGDTGCKACSHLPPMCVCVIAFPMCVSWVLFCRSHLSVM